MIIIITKLKKIMLAELDEQVFENKVLKKIFGPKYDEMSNTRSDMRNSVTYTGDLILLE
jgi:hypothetical protein